MKILFIRHGEAMDDVDDRYGGWADDPLSPLGRDQVREQLAELSGLGIQFSTVVTSPFLRARETGEIIARHLGIPLQVMHYVKEWNKYGVLTGMAKSKAKERYPDQVQALDNGGYIDASERIYDFTQRIRKGLGLIEAMNIDACIVATHGNFMKVLLSDFLRKAYTKLGLCAYILVELRGGEMKYLGSSRVDFPTIEANH